MFALLSPRFLIGLALVTVLAFTHGFSYKAGRSAVRADWDKEKAVQVADALKASEVVRTKEQALIATNEKVTNDYLAQKKLRAADAVANTGRLRDLKTALLAISTGTDAATPSGIDADPRNSIISECSSAVVTLDDAVKAMAGQTIALQTYVRDVCLADKASH